MPQLILARGASYKNNPLKKYLKNVEVGPYFLIGSLITFVALITVITLMFSARQVTKGYVLNQLETQNQQLTRETEQKDMQISQVRSLNYIEQSSKVASMRNPYEIVYLNADNTIAKK